MGKRKSIVEDSSEAEESASEQEAPKQHIKKPRITEFKRDSKSKKKERDTSDEEPKKSSTSNVLTSADGERYIDLGKKKRATIRDFKGMALIDIREFYNKDGKDLPGKKGISLQVEQWEALKDNAQAIDELIAKLKK